ncbi:MAG: ATP-binding cassette domain-containing protein [Oscillospiraceae bacterium]
MEILRIEALNFTYALGTTPALQDISLSVEDGEFLLLCGRSGCGKSTLLRHCKPSLRPAGRLCGHILFAGKAIEEADNQIGFVMQNPDAQIVTDMVWHELAFGLENQGVPTPEIRRRVAEMANYFGIHTWFRKRTAELSGGQKQLLNLAAVMLMNPQLLILDEPTAQLDPIASQEFINMLGKLNRELGTTILLTEHNLEEAFALSHRVVLMRDGRVLTEKSPREMVKVLAQCDHEGMFCALPSAARIAADCPAGGDVPLTVVEGRYWMSRRFANRQLTLPKRPPISPRGHEEALTLRDVWFSYQKGSDPVLRNLNLHVMCGESFAILGGNGSGKTTALSMLAGRLKPLDGKAFVAGVDVAKQKSADLFFHNLGVLPQNPQSLFVFETLHQDLEEVLKLSQFKLAERDCRVANIAERMDLTRLLMRHPYDLSGGELQKAALAKILLLEPKILLLDEPTKGLDALSKRRLGELLRVLQADGMTILMVTHDVEFAALYADRCALFFDGFLVSEADTRTFFTSNRFYTTATARITQHLAQGIMTCEEGVALCQENASF